jgi:hypothetical protein
MTDEKQVVRSRLFLILVTLPLIAAITAFTSMIIHNKGSLETAEREFGRTTVTQLSEQYSQYLVNKDVLSLNVLVTNLTKQTPIAYVGVYDESNRLIVQSGKHRKDNQDYTADITFQDAMIGLVRVTVSQPEKDSTFLIFGWLIGGAIYLYLAWQLCPIISRWLLGIGPNPLENEHETSTIVASDGPVQECILVVKIRPARHLEIHFDRFFKAAKLYGGIVEQTTIEELVIHFSGADAMYMAASTGLLIKEITKQVNRNITFGGTLDILNDKPDTVRKASSYLASIAQNDLLAAGGTQFIIDRAELAPFHHSLVDSKNLLKVIALNDQSLIDAQALELST